jgi:hypothetical protein
MLTLNRRFTIITGILACFFLLPSTSQAREPFDCATELKRAEKYLEDFILMKFKAFRIKKSLWWDRKAASKVSRRIEKEIKAVKGALGKVEKAYSRIMKNCESELKVASMYKLACANENYAKKLDSFPLPKGLIPDQEEIFRLILRDTAKPHEDEAMRYYRKVADLAKSENSTLSRQATDKLREFCENFKTKGLWKRELLALRTLLTVVQPTSDEAEKVCQRITAIETLPRVGTGPMNKRDPQKVVQPSKSIVSKLEETRMIEYEKEYKRIKNEKAYNQVKKYDPKKLEFVAVPLAVPHREYSTVRLVGGFFYKVKYVTIGCSYPKWKQLDDYTLEIAVPPFLRVGSHHIMIVFKEDDRIPLSHSNGIVVTTKRGR